MLDNCRLRQIYVCLFLGVCAPAHVSALELTSNLYSDTHFSDNIELSGVDEHSDTVQTVGLSVRVNESRKFVEVGANLNFEQEYYLQNTYSDQTSITTGIGLLNLGVIESFIDWNSSFSRTELLSDSSESDTPDNREYRNVYRSGPVISYNYSDATRIEFSASYIGVELSDEDESDTKRYEVNANFLHILNSIASISTNHSYEEIIDGDGSEEYTSVLNTIGVSRQFSKGQLVASLGQTVLRSDLRDSETASFYDVMWRQDQIWWHDLSLRYQEDISDTSLGITNNEEEQVSDETSEENASDIDTSANDIVSSKRLSFSAYRDMESFDYTLAYNQYEYDYSSSTQREEGRAFSVQVEQQVSSGLSLVYLYSKTIDEYIGRPDIGKDNTSRYRFGSNYLFSDRLSTNAFVQFLSRTNSNNAAREYDEISVGFGIDWQLD